MFYSSGGICTNTLNRCQVLKGCSDPNPYECTCTYPTELTLLVGKKGGPNKDDPHAIDVTYPKIGEKRYSVVSGSDDNGEQSISITQLDTKTWKVIGCNVVSEPDQAWERNTALSDLVAEDQGPDMSLR